jgi:hypothetical protein
VASDVAGEVVAGGGVGYGAVYQTALRKLLAGDAYATAEEAVKAAIEEEDFDEAITIIFSSGILPLIHALIGFRRSLPGNALVDTITERLRPLGPQWVANVLGAALLPEPIAPMRRKRLAPRPEVWALICKCALDKILWADVCYGIIAEGNGRHRPRPRSWHPSRAWLGCGRSSRGSSRCSSGSGA